MVRGVYEHHSRKKKTMNPEQDEIQAETEALDQKHAAVLKETAQKLLAREILKVHFGIDFVNDDGDLADYAVLEYSDGRVEELDHWLEDLPYETFLWHTRECQPYTFDTKSATIDVDKDGGMIDGAEEMVIRAYHTQARREMLEQESVQEPWELDAFSGSNTDELQDLASALLMANINKVFFGVDYIEDYQLSDWVIAELTDQTEVPLEQFAELETQFRTTLEGFITDYSQLGAFYFDCETAWLFPDPQGGIIDMGNEVEQSYHTEEQRAALED